MMEEIFHDGGPYHIEISPLCFVKKAIRLALYDKDLHHEIIKT